MSGTAGAGNDSVAPFGGADLHAHTTASDGELSPAAFARHAATTGLAAVAVTDHDTTAGCREAMEAASGIKLVPGIEISCDSTMGACHILGLFIDPESPYLVEPLSFLRKRRRERAAGILDRLAKLGIRISLPDRPDPYAVGRPHIARALVEAGHVGSHQEAFERYLAHGKPGYVPSPRVMPVEAIEMIHRAGGVAVLAHPHTFHDIAMISAYAAKGLGGLEARYAGYDKKHEAYWTGVARKLGLVITAGSDFHGTVRADRRLGMVRMTEEEFATLKRRRRRG